MSSTTKRDTRVITTLTLLLFVLAVAYCILRCLKDAVTLTGSSAGAEMLPFIKVWGMLPASIIMATLFTWLSRHMSIARLFYVMISGYLTYYIAFVLFIYPYREHLELSTIGNWLTMYLPVGFRGLVQMIQHWPISSFYVMSEMWATTIINVLFWGYTNDRISPEMAKRFYGKIKIGATLSALGGGYLAALVSFEKFNPALPYGTNVWEQTMMHDTACIVILGIIGMVLFRSVNSQLSHHTPVEKKKKKVRMSLPKALRYVSRSPYLICLSIIVIGYNLAFNLSDVLWKQQVSLAYPDPSDLMAYMNRIMMAIGAISLVAVLVSGPIVRRYGWRFLGGITPLTMLTTSVGFFIVWLWGFPLPVILGAGAINNCLSKAGKYSVFDIAKELAFTPLDLQTKWNGKAAIDGIGNDIGKTGASLAHQVLLMVFGSMAMSFPYVAGIIVITLIAWIASVQYIGSSYDELLEEPAPVRE